MKKAMDLFGEALYAYWKGDRSNLFIFEDGKRFKLHQRIYFRGPERLTKLERKLISLSYGRILDVGCATGYYILELMRMGDVKAIDISEHAIKVARELGLTNCKVGDIFRYHAKIKFDTITLLQNSLGMAGSLPNCKRLLIKLSSLLKKDGQILLIHRKSRENYVIHELRLQWKGRTSPGFKWVFLNSGFLSKICHEAGLKTERIGQTSQYDLISIKFLEAA